MLQKKIAYMSQMVSDQDKALEYYTRVLGFEKVVDSPNPGSPRFIAVGVKGHDFQLVLWPGTPGQAQPAHGRVPATVTIEVEDCRSAYETLKAKGVHFETDVLEFPWGCVAIFVDPDGNRLQVRQGR